MLRHAHVFPDDVDRFNQVQFVALQKYVADCEQLERAAPGVTDAG